MHTDLLHRLVDFTDDDAMVQFLTNVQNGEVLTSIDMLAANPDIRADVWRGEFVFNLYALVHEGVSIFVVEVDDGEAIELSEVAIASAYFVSETEAEARAVLDERIVEWKRVWHLPIRTH